MADDLSQIGSDPKVEKIRSGKFISTSGPLSRKLSPSTKECVELDYEPVLPPLKSRSIFAQRMAQKVERNNSGMTSGSLSMSPTSACEGMIDHDKVTQEIQSIMRNIGAISESQSVTPEDILKVREEIMKSMSKRNLEFLRGRSSSRDPVQSQFVGQKTKPECVSKCGAPKESGKEDKSRACMPTKQILESLPIEPSKVENVPHMNCVELPKLEWTLSTGDGKTQSMQARFDLHGKLVSSGQSLQTTWLKGLHHHGEEMDRPGYTFEELLIYARSSNASQRAFALNSLAGVFRNSHEGAYDNVLNINPLDLLANVDVISVIRKSIDFNDVVTLDAAFACLGAVCFPTSEEECYDVAFLYPNSKPFPWHKVTTVDRQSVMDPSTRDHQILTLDLLLFFIQRSHILDRLEYLLVTRAERISEAVKLSILQILIRMARHSPDTLIESVNLLNRINSFIVVGDWPAISAVPGNKSITDPETVNINPVAISAWLALKMFRVLVESSVHIAKTVHSRYNIMHSVLTYLATDCRYGIQSCCHAKLIIFESFRFWCSSLHVGLAVNECNTIFPVLALHLRHFCNAETLQNIVGFDGYYLSHVFHFLHAILLCGERRYSGISCPDNAWAMIKDLEYFVLTITMNVLQILTSSRDDWALALAGQGLSFLTTAFKMGMLENRKASIVEHIKQLDFSDIASSLQQHSVILNMTKIRSRYPSNYISSSAVLTPSKMNSIVTKKSPFQFLNPWFSFLHELRLTSLCFTPKVCEYVELLADSYPLEFFETYYIRFEQQFIYKMLVSADIENVPLSLVVHLVCTLSKNDMVLFRGLLGLMMNKIEALEEYQENILSLYMECYYPGVKVQNIKSSAPETDSSEWEFNEKTILFQPIGTKLVKGKFWMLEPLRKLSERYSQRPGDLKKHLSLVIKETHTCLYFIQYFLKEPAVLSTSTDLITYYIRITQIFSMGEDVFLEHSIEVLLEHILKALLTLLESNLAKDPQPFTNFKPGPDLEQISTFKDYYRELVKDFESVSYCSNTFSAYLLFPLVASESRDLKLLFWSMQGLQFVRLELNNNLLPPDYLTKEVEKDRALLQLYTILLVKTSTVNRTSNEFLFHALDYHVTRGLPVEDMQKVMKLM